MHLALARKYRPQSFDEVLGQGAVLTTLQNAITGARLHHAYLFCGARGVGKTSLARILAKSINCVNGPTTKPCQACTACQSITRGNSMDVLEIDGASHNSVDNVRELREQVKYLPTEGRYKIFIIDEVHMLSGAAFNALLKTLEEPPAHVIFIFATTEPHDLPVTILSRCQKYDFRKMSTEQLTGHLQKLLQAEDVEAEEGAVRLIARCAQGSVRDALSLLDQAIGFAAGKMSEAAVRDVLGLGERVLVEDFFAALIRADLDAALKAVQDADGRGLDLKIFAEETLACFRHLILLQATGKSPPELSSAEADFFEKLKSVRDAALVLSQYQILASAITEMARTDFQKTALEITCVKIAQADQLMGLAELVANLMEKQAARSSTPDKLSRPVAPTQVAHVNAPHPVKLASPLAVPPTGVALKARDWYELAKWIAGEKPALGGALRQAVPIQFDAARIEVGFDAKASSRDIVIERRQMIGDMISTHFGRPVEFVVSEMNDEKKKS